MTRRPPRSTLFPSPTLFRSLVPCLRQALLHLGDRRCLGPVGRVALADDLELAVADERAQVLVLALQHLDRKSTRLNSSHQIISYAVFCLKKKKICGTNSIPR